MRKFDLSLRSSRSSYFADRKSGSAGMPRPISYAVFCLKKKMTVLDIFYYLRRGRDYDFIHRAMPSLTREQFDAVVEYAIEHREELVKEDQFFLELMRQPISTLFPYTTLFRSYELNRSGLLAENEKIRPILAQLEKLLLCDLSPSTNDSVKN